MASSQKGFYDDEDGEYVIINNLFPFIYQH